MEKINFKNYEDEQTTPINAQALNAIQDNVESAINNIDVSEKADITYVDSELELKADKTYVDSELELKADQATTYTKTEVDTSLGLKANKTYVDTELDKKADKLKYIRLRLSNIDINFTEKVLNTWSVSESSGDFTSNSTSIIAPESGLMRIGFSIYVRYFAFKDVQFYLTKNGTDIGRCPCEVTAHNIASFNPMIVSVNQGDVFQIRMESTGWTSGNRKGYLASGDGTSWFQAEMIE